MLSKLYNKVFSKEKNNFHPGNTYYTLVLNLSAKTPVYSQLLTDMDRHLGSELYSAYALDAALTEDPNIAASLRGLLTSRFGRNVNTAFYVLIDMADGGNGAAVKRVIDALYDGALVAPGDKVVMIAVLPSETAQAKTGIAALDAYDLQDSVIRYFVSHNRYNQEQVVDDICGIVLLHSNKAVSEEIIRDRIRTENEIRTEIQSFGADGRQKLAASRKTAWSTVVTSYKDNRMSFLKKYLLYLLNRIDRIENFDISGFCHTFFNQHLAQDMAQMLDILKKAVDRIPLVASSVKLEDMTLQTYLNLCYSTGGYGGEKILELTLKVNLSRNRRGTQALVKKAAEALLEKMGAYESEDLIGEVISILSDFGQKQKRSCDEKKRMLTQFLETASAGENELDEYIKRYIIYDSELRKKEFWREVSHYIQQNKEDFLAFCMESAARITEIEHLKESLYIIDAEDFDAEIGMQYPAKVVLDLQDNEELCQQCYLAYVRYESAEKESIDSNTSGVPRIFDRIYEVHPSFRRDYEYCLDVGNAFSVNVKHRNGNYSVFDM